MTIHHVHLYREMRLAFGYVEAKSAEAAAEIARNKPTSEADSIEDCEGETFAAVVDVVEDDDFRRSVTIEFEPRRGSADATLDPTSIDSTLLNIARNHLGLETLETRNSDRLDFREQAVWTIRAALEAAFQAGFDASRRSSA